MTYLWVIHVNCQCLSVILTHRRHVSPLSTLTDWGRRREPFVAITTPDNISHLSSEEQIRATWMTFFDPDLWQRCLWFGRCLTVMSLSFWSLFLRCVTIGIDDPNYVVTLWTRWPSLRNDVVCRGLPSFCFSCCFVCCCFVCYFCCYYLLLTPRPLSRRVTPTCPFAAEFRVLLLPINRCLPSLFATHINSAPDLWPFFSVDISSFHRIGQHSGPVLDPIWLDRFDDPPRWPRIVYHKLQFEDLDWVISLVCCWSRSLSVVIAQPSNTEQKNEGSSVGVYISATDAESDINWRLETT